MARNQDRQFGESDSLKNLGAEIPEAEERIPAWAVRPAEENKNEEAAPAASDSRAPEEENPLRRGNAPLFGLNEENGEREEKVKQETADKSRADDAWTREAKRVESTQHQRSGRFGAEAGDHKKDEKEASAKRKNAGSKKKSSRKKKKKQQEEDRRGFIRSMMVIVICAVLFIMVAMMVLSNFISHPLLALPRKMVTTIITPVQSVFTTVTDSVVNYLRTLKIRGNLEYEYEQLTILLDDYANQIAQNEELRRINEELYDLLDEQERNRSMNPVAATVIGTDSGNYFSTLTLDVGSSSGVEEYMAVVAQGGLVGVTYDVEENKCQVRCIIDSDCTVAALIQSSRDQGSVKGTLGINGEPMCRMYYLPDTSLPRPGDTVVTSGVGLEFPKGIPIGYIRESTRGMEENKSYVVLEPVVDFQHLEYVTVYRYKPAYAEEAQAREQAGVLELEPLSTPRIVPEWQLGSVSDFIFGATETPVPSATPGVQPGSQQAMQPGAMTQAPTATPATQPGAISNATLAPDDTDLPENLEYIPASDSTPSPTPRPTATPAPTPVPTADPGGMTVEEEE
ncbi:MAG: rod shape-determining protein MreC [Clostridia bacterium]|nr:rod shape-determining protein MreC [Clostridia bacterium]